MSPFLTLSRMEFGQLNSRTVQDKDSVSSSEIGRGRLGEPVDAEASQQGIRSRSEVCPQQRVVRHQVAQRTLLGDDSLFPWSRRLPTVRLVNAEKPTEPCRRDPICGSLPAPDECDRRTMNSHTFTLILSG